MDRASVLLDFCGGRLEIVCLLDATSLGRMLRCSKAARVVVKHEWRCWDARFQTFNATHLESALVSQSMPHRLLPLNSCVLVYRAQVSWSFFGAGTASRSASCP